MKIRNKNGDIAMNLIEIKRIIREYIEQLYTIGCQRGGACRRDGERLG